MDVISSQKEFDLSTFFGICRRGIEQEIRAQDDNLKTAGLSNGLDVFGGTDHADAALDGHGAEFVYTFRYRNPITIEDVPVELPTGAQCSFLRGGVRANGRVRSHALDERSVTVALEASVGKGSKLTGKLTFNLAYLLENLLAHLDEIIRRCEAEPALAKTIFGFVKGVWAVEETPSIPSEFLEHLRLNSYQRSAVERTLGDNHHLIWGPPGTGKTSTLGAAVLVRCLGQPDARVIILAHTNVALDNAIRAIWSSYQALRPDQSVDEFIDDVGLHRIGRAGADDVSQVADALHDGLLGADQTVCEAILSLERAFRLSNAGSMRQRAGRVLRQIRIEEEEGRCPEVLSNAARGLEQRLGELEEKAIERCRVLCCTLSQLDIKRELLRSLRWDASYVDEISMIGIARAVPVVALGGPFFGFGDFQQLSPIVQSKLADAREALGKDIFHWMGAQDHTSDDPRRTMLELQYRMKEEICRPISSYFYDSRLLTDEGVSKRDAPFHYPVHAVYTDSLKPKNRAAGKSKCNDVHAQLAAHIVEALWAQGLEDIGVVAPYSAQVERIKEHLAPSILAKIDVSTVHSYQGREKEIIIFDSMLAGGEATGFLQASKNRDIGKLLNVALSRAKNGLWLLLDENAARTHWARQDTYSSVICGLAAIIPECLDIENQYEPTEISYSRVRQFVENAMKAQ